MQNIGSTEQFVYLIAVSLYVFKYVLKTDKKKKITSYVINDSILVTDMLGLASSF